jgi:hypothetical protein
MEEIENPGKQEKILRKERNEERKVQKSDSTEQTKKPGVASIPTVVEHVSVDFLGDDVGLKDKRMKLEMKEFQEEEMIPKRKKSLILRKWIPVVRVFGEFPSQLDGSQSVSIVLHVISVFW